MGRWQAVLILVALAALPARAQESLSSRLEPAYCFAIFCEREEPPSPGPTESDPTALPRTSWKTSGQLDLNTLERYHQRFHAVFQTEHRPRLYNFLETVATSFHGRPPSHYVDWYRGAKGFEWLQRADGQLALGFEVQRVLLFATDRGTYPIQDVSVCNAAGVASVGSCGSVPFRTNNRRYALRLRWTPGGR
jgi:hypothetical protein